MAMPCSYEDLLNSPIHWVLIRDWKLCSLGDINPATLGGYTNWQRWLIFEFMLHLAQVKAHSIEKTTLQLLAAQKSDPVWEVLPAESIATVDRLDDSIGVLLLVELAASNKVVRVEPAKDWVLDLVEQYLAVGITPETLQQEEQRAEQWRQSLTLQSQELGRRSLEMEARCDQIQDLEEKLKAEKQQLDQTAKAIEARHSEVIALQTAVDAEKQRMLDRIAELEAKLNQP